MLYEVITQNLSKAKSELMQQSTRFEFAINSRITSYNVCYTKLLRVQLHATMQELLDDMDASPLTSYFTTNTNKTLETTFSGKLDTLREVCRGIGGREQKAEGYDCSILFYALPRVPVVLRNNFV